MSAFLLHLQGPMMAYGDSGFGQLRTAGPFPSRSAVLGIIGAALGVERGAEQLLALHKNLRVHVASVVTGPVLVDYHTVSTAGYEEYDSVRMRRSTPSGTNPVLTDRSYHLDSHFVVAIQGNDTGMVEECVAALGDPVFTGYLGRRSCPPTTLLRPIPASDENMLDAMSEAVDWGRRQRMESLLPWQRKKSVAFDLYVDGDDSELPSATQMKSSVVARSYRRDLLVALPRSYVNRPVTHWRITPSTISSDISTSTNEEYFDATP